MKSKNILIIVLVIVVIILGLDLWVSKHTANTVQPTQTSSTSTTGWKTYTNPQYSFSFKYPENYKLLGSEHMGPNGYTETDAEMDMLNQDTAAIAPSINVDVYPLSFYAGSSNWTPQDSINEKNAIEKGNVSGIGPDDAIITKIIGKTLVYAEVSHQSATLYYYMISYNSNTDRIIVYAFNSDLNKGNTPDLNNITPAQVENDPTWQVFVSLAKSFSLTQ